MILRLSQKLSAKIKAGSLKDAPLNENLYADWTCRLFTADRTQYIMLTNTQSLYSCVMYGKGSSNDSAFIKRALSTIREFVEYDGQQFVYQQFIAPASGTVRFAKALNRKVTGSMNDLVYHAEIMLVEDELAPSDVGDRLNEIPMSALDWASPKAAFKTLLTDGD